MAPPATAATSARAEDGGQHAQGADGRLNDMVRRILLEMFASRPLRPPCRPAGPAAATTPQPRTSLAVALEVAPGRLGAAEELRIGAAADRHGPDIAVIGLAAEPAGAAAVLRRAAAARTCRSAAPIPAWSPAVGDHAAGREADRDVVIPATGARDRRMRSPRQSWPKTAVVFIGDGETEGADRKT